MAPIHILTGAVHGGKTSLAGDLVRKLESRNLLILGFLCRGEFEKGERSLYRLELLPGHRTLPMASRARQKAWLPFKRFHFNPKAFEEAEKWLKQEIQAKDSSSGASPQLIVIDEAGPMEMEGLGWDQLLKTLKKLPQIPQLWIVREGILKEIIARYDLVDAPIYRADSTNVLALQSELGL